MIGANFFLLLKYNDKVEILFLESIVFYLIVYVSKSISSIVAFYRKKSYRYEIYVMRDAKARN